MKRALLLNSDYTPLHFINEFDAITLFYKGRAEVITGASGNPSEWDESFRSPTTSIKIPATMRLRKRVNKRWHPPRFRKKVLFNRDNWQCQFCSEKLVWESVTIDHVLPSSRGGKTSWSNCVTCCKACNRKKSNMTPEEAGMKLLKKPGAPSSFHFWDVMRCNVWHDDWLMFLPKPE